MAFPIKTGIPKLNLASAMKHHANIGLALKAGNPNLAMHHTGHMMLALKAAAKPKAMTEPNPLPMNPPSSLRSRLAGLKAPKPIGIPNEISGAGIPNGQ